MTLDALARVSVDHWIGFDLMRFELKEGINLPLPID
jgi:hypothetical protein